MDLKFITENPMLKTLLLGKLKKAFAEHGVSLVTITTDSKGELDFKVYTEEMKVMTQVDFINTLNIML